MQPQSKNDPSDSFEVVTSATDSECRGSERSLGMGQALRDLELGTSGDCTPEVQREGRTPSPDRGSRREGRNVQWAARHHQKQQLAGIPEQQHQEDAGESTTGEIGCSSAGEKEVDHPKGIGQKTAHCFYFRKTNLTPRFTRGKRGPILANANGKAVRAPEFVLADHTRDTMPHYHVLFCTSKTGSYGKPFQRIGSYLGLDYTEIQHAKATCQKVQDLDNFLMYLNKYGTD